MTRTTIALEPGILREVKLRAAASETTMQKTVNDLLRLALRAPTPKPYRFKLGVNRSKMNPKLDVCSRDSIDEVLGGRWG